MTLVLTTLAALPWAVKILALLAALYWTCRLVLAIVRTLTELVKAGRELADAIRGSKS